MRPYRFALLATVFVSGCATSYHPTQFGGGYREAQLDRNVFRVTFDGNVASTQASTDRMALLRGAEIAREHGFPFFISSGAAPTGSAMSIASGIVRIPASTITIVCYAERPETRAIVYAVDALIGEVREVREIAANRSLPAGRPADAAPADPAAFSR